MAISLVEGPDILPFEFDRGDLIEGDEIVVAGAVTRSVARPSVLSTVALVSSMVLTVELSSPETTEEQCNVRAHALPLGRYTLALFVLVKGHNEAPCSS